MELMKGKDNVIVYIDKFLIHSQIHEQLLATLDLIMNRLSENNKKINLSKCFCGTYKVSYLGFRLIPNSIKSGKDKLCIKPAHQTQKELLPVFARNGWGSLAQTDRFFLKIKKSRRNVVCG
jgi:hypothetical protein